MNYKRTHSCNELNHTHINQSVTLSGWVHKRRDLGGLIFIDLRDRFGLTQLIFDPKTSHKAYEQASQLRAEWVISIQGNVKSRGETLTNTTLPTGSIEVTVTTLTVLSQAKTPPFSIADDHTETHEDIRLKYRYLDLRKSDILNRLTIRHQVMMLTRTFFHNHAFIEISTPILGRSTPEGARDYLVPSRVYPGNFYALPQSPQLFKQLLMIGGADRYFQLSPCFRDEDLRADRQAEFTQLDIEMSFLYPEDLQQLIHQYLSYIFKEILNYTIPAKIPKMTYAECLENYGTDRPDLRFGMPLIRVDDIAQQSSFTIFHEQIKKDGCVKAICIKNGQDISRKTIDQYTAYAQQFGLKGLGWMKKTPKGFTSGISKYFSTENQAALTQRIDANDGDLLLFAAGDPSTVNQSLDHLRRKIAQQRHLIPSNTYAFVWVVDFPCFEWDDQENRPKSTHHPFTMPHPEDIHLLTSDPLRVRSHAYDIVINGQEVGGGSQRIHDYKLQTTVFETLKLSQKEIQESFGFFTEALQYGTPPHLGIALGFDRLMMILTQTSNIKDVIAFPKTQKASDLMIQCPASIDEKQLKELQITTKTKEITWI